MGKVLLYRLFCGLLYLLGKTVKLNIIIGRLAGWYLTFTHIEKRRRDE